MQYFYFILGYVIAPLGIGWAISLPKDSVANALGVTLITLVFTVVFIIIGAFIRYRYGG